MCHYIDLCENLCSLRACMLLHIPAQCLLATARGTFTNDVTGERLGGGLFVLTKRDLAFAQANLPEIVTREWGGRS